jgi:hypothetical protein
VNRRIRFALAVALLLVAAAAISAQQNPDIERGARPGLAYRVDGLDHTSLFNGTVTLNVPLGQTYTVNGTLSYSFMASYATNAWETGVS